MTSNLRRGDKGDPLPSGIVVIRLGKSTMDSTANESHFILSDDDKKSDLQSLSVWAEELTSAKIARRFMKNSGSYPLALYLNVDDIRAISVDLNFPNPPLDVVWDPRPEIGAEGHAGIVGLMRQPGIERMKYAALRSKLARLATVEVLSGITD